MALEPSTHAASKGVLAVRTISLAKKVTNWRETTQLVITQLHLSENIIQPTMILKWTVSGGPAFGLSNVHVLVKIKRFSYT